MGICASDWTDADGGITTPYGTLHDDEGHQTGSATTQPIRQLLVISEPFIERLLVIAGLYGHWPAGHGRIQRRTVLRHR